MRAMTIMGLRVMTIMRVMKVVGVIWVIGLNEVLDGTQLPPDRAILKYSNGHKIAEHS